MKALHLLRAIPLATMILATPVNAEQGTIVGPVTGPHTMADVMGTLNAAMLAIQTCNSGTAAPTNGPSSLAVHYQCWADTSGSPTIAYKYYDGASWVTVGTLNTSTHVWTPYRNGSAIVAVATSGSASDLTTGTLPAALLPTPSSTTLGGVKSKAAVSKNYLTQIGTDGSVSQAQPVCADLSDAAASCATNTTTQANVSFTGLSSAAAAADADTFPTNQGASNLKQTLSAIKTWIKAWIVKADVGLGNVDNTSDVTKWSASATLTTKTINCANNTCTVRLADLPTGTQDTVLGYWGSTALSALAIGNCSNALTYSSSTHTFGCNSIAGTGTVTSVTLSSGPGIDVSGTCTITSNGTCAVQETASLIGEVKWVATTRAPVNHLKADGSAVSRTTYASLFAKLVYSATVTFTNGSADIGWTAHGLSAGDPIKLFNSGGALPTNFTAGTHGLSTAGTTYCVLAAGLTANAFRIGATCGGSAITAGSAGSGTQTAVNAPWGDGDGSTSFTLPALMGEFVRNWDAGAGIDANRMFGLDQLDDFKSHTHSGVMQNAVSQIYTFTGGGSGGWGNSGATGGSETRPRNNTLLPIIRYQ